MVFLLVSVRVSGAGHISPKRACTQKPRQTVGGASWSGGLFRAGETVRTLHVMTAVVAHRLPMAAVPHDFPLHRRGRGEAARGRPAYTHFACGAAARAAGVLGAAAILRERR